MSSISYNNPFQLPKQYSKPLSKPAPKQAPQVSQPTLKNSSRAFGALKMARFMAEGSATDLAADTFQASSRFDETVSMGRPTPMSSSMQRVQPATRLQDTQAGLLHALSSPALKRDAAPLVSDEWLSNAPVYDDMSIYQSPMTNPWQQVKDKLMDIFFEPLPEQAAPTVAVPVNVQSSAKAQQERPIGIAQLTRVTFSSTASKAPERSPLERLKRTSPGSGF